MIPTELRSPLAALILILLAGTAAVGVALHLHGEAVAARQQAERQWAEAHTRLDQLPQRIALVRTLGRHYADLQRRGFVGEARRLDWISALARAQRELELQAVTWRLEPSRPTALPGLTATRMHLSLAPMDPARLGVWLARLDSPGQGLFTVEACDWTLAERPQRMQCTLNWWTWNGGGSAR